MKELASFISQLLLNDDIFLPEEEISMCMRAVLRAENIFRFGLLKLD